MNISSAIIRTQATQVELLRGRLAEITGVEVYAVSDEGRFVVSIESADDQGTASVFEAILRLDGVLSASLVYSHFESDPDGEIQVVPRPTAMPH
jgi:nitrate reductase NapD